MYSRLFLISALSLTLTTGCAVTADAPQQVQYVASNQYQTYSTHRSKVLKSNAPLEEAVNREQIYAAQPYAHTVKNNAKTAQPSLVSVAYANQAMQQGYSRPALSHIISEGETVYSLARQQCTTVQAIQATNGLDAAFNIHIGDIITLPSSQC